MVFAGVDLHKRYSVVTVVDEKGVVLKRERLNNVEGEILSFFGSFEEDIKAVIEAGCNWCWFSDLLRENDIPLTLAHPLKTKAIASAKIKNDAIDSTILAHLLRADLIPEAYQPDKETRERRELIRSRAFLVRLRSSLKGRIHGILTKLNIAYSGSDLFGKGGRAFLSKLELPPVFADELKRYLRIIDFLSKEIEALSAQIKVRAEEDEAAKLLMDIPGIGYHLALLILAEIGDVNRFSSSKKLVSFSGLCPSTHSSGGKTYHGKIVKQGSKWLRWAMIEAATKAAKHEPTIRRFYEDLKKAKGAKRARVAVGRKLLENIYHMLSKGETFDEALKRMGRAR